LRVQTQSRGGHEYAAIVAWRSLLHQRHRRYENRAVVSQRRRMADTILVTTVEQYGVVGICQEIALAELQSKYTAANQDELSGG